MNTVDSDTLDTAVAVKPVVMYKTERGYNINVLALAQAARDDIENVRMIAIPAPVKRHKINNQEFDAPTLSEVGGGSVRNNFCQVVAGKDGRPVCVEDVHYINTDPTRSNINHGTASVGIGNFFSIGWTMKADVVLLMFEIIQMEEFETPQTDDRAKPIAKLTCELVGYEISNWKSNFQVIPDHLLGLASVTHERLRNDTDIPFFMDIFRRINKPVDELKWVADQVLTEEILDLSESEYNFMPKVMREILDIRYCQYEALAADNSRRADQSTTPRSRKVDPLRVVETLRLDPSGAFIDITLTPVREDGTNNTFRIRLTHSNFENLETGRQLLERNLVLGATSYDRLKLELENRRSKNDVTVVNLISLR